MDGCGVCLGAAVVTLYFVFACYLWNVHRLLRLVRPEHREMEPNRVWLSLIPVIGMGFAYWMVVAIARSLGKQYTALGEHRPDDDYGETSGQGWAGSALIGIVMGLSCCGCLRLEGPNALNAIGIVAFFNVIVVLIFISSFIRHWYVIEKNLWRLSQRFSPAVTQEELDYGDDLPPPQDGPSP